MGNRRVHFTPFCWGNRPLSLGDHVESQENKKLCFCMASLALNLRLGDACRANFSKTQHGPV